ncbi:MAG: Fe-S cluster assembly protein HesB, partial [Candidatus Heimdallarchaeaceae archaeon]
NDVSTFQNKIFSWWKDNKRTFPWRETTDPYHVLVSEIMLQQTQTNRVVPKYNKFIRIFPTLESLCKASKAKVLTIWSGLGYNRRALWLQNAAKTILENGYFPSSIDELEQLKGIGAYTARSILIFAFNKDLAAVDTNIRKVFIVEGFASEKTKESELFKIAERLLPKGKSRDWHNALMDYGALELSVKKAKIKPLSQQKKFKGSDREKRGKILKFILENKQVSVDELSKLVGIPQHDLVAILNKMEIDGLIKKTHGQYCVK